MDQGSPYGVSPGYTAPYAARPVRPGRGFGIAGLVLGIIGAVYAFVLLTTQVAQGTFITDPELAAGFVPLGILIAVFGLLSVVFSVISAAKGCRSGARAAGLALGIETLVISGLTMFCALVGFLLFGSPAA